MCFRWLCYCRVPSFCDSLPKHELTAIFGRTLIKSIFPTARRQIMEKFEADRDKMPVEKRPLVLEQFPKYVTDWVSGCLVSLSFLQIFVCTEYAKQTLFTYICFIFFVTLPLVGLNCVRHFIVLWICVIVESQFYFNSTKGVLKPILKSLNSFG